MSETEASKTLAVLRATVEKERPAGSLAASPTGVRLLDFARTIGWGGKKPLSIAQVVQISAVLVCLDVLAQDIAKVTLRMYERLPNGGKREVEADEHPVAMLLKTEPNRFHTWPEFIEMMMLHLGMVQNAFVAKRMTRVGVVEELIPVMPARVTILAIEPDQDKSGRGFYAYDVPRYSPHEKIQLAGLPDVFLEHEFIHLRGRMFDGLSGYSNLEAGARTFGLASELIDYQTRLFKNDGQLRGVFQHPGEVGTSLSQEAFDRLQDQLAKAMQEFRQENKPMVLEEGMVFEKIAMNADQAEVAKARDSAVVDCARNFRIPPHKIMHLVNVKYENMETLEKSYVQDSLIPYCRRIEPRLERSLMSREDRAKFFLQFDRKEMLLNDMKMLSEVTKDMAGLGAVEVDEIRQTFGWNPLGGEAGQVRFIPSTYNVVDRKNEVVIAAGAQPADDGEEKPAGEKPKPKPKPKKDIEDESGLDNVFPLHRAGD